MYNIGLYGVTGIRTDASQQEANLAWDLCVWSLHGLPVSV